MAEQYIKNVAGYFIIPMIDKAAPESYKTGETVTDTAYYKNGAGAWASLAITDIFSEIGSTGLYEIDLTAAEMNHDQIIIKCTAANSQDNSILIKTIAGVQAECEDAISNKFSIVDGVVEANVKKIDDDDGAGTKLKLDYDGTGYNKASSTVGTVSALGAQAKLDVNAQVDAALDTAIPGTPTAGSVNDVLKDVDAKLPTNNIMGSGVKTDKDDEIDAIKTKTDGLNFSGANVDASIEAVEGNTAAAGNLADDYNGTGYNKSNSEIGIAAEATALGTQAKADVKGEVDDVLNTDVQPELSQGVPPNTESIGESITRLRMALVMKGNQTSTEKAFYNSGGTKITKKSVSDDGSTYEELQMVSGA